jgi:hypothetical protein
MARKKQRMNNRKEIKKFKNMKEVQLVNNKRVSGRFQVIKYVTFFTRQL